VLKGTPKIVTTPVLTLCLKLNLLYTDQTQENFDLETLLCFLVLYSQNIAIETRAELFFDLVSNPRNDKLVNKSEALPRVMA